MLRIGRESDDMGAIPPSPPVPRIVFIAVDEYGNEEVVPAPKKEEPEHIESRFEILDL